MMKMAHKDWCGKPCADCQNPCTLDQSIPCSPDCHALNPDGSRDKVQCVGCDTIVEDSKQGKSATVLYRPVGQKELDLIEQTGFKAFPPRLPEQPIFYPVLNEQYANEIASRWNAKMNEQRVGYVTKFTISGDYISKHEVHIVGASYHQELWIPAEELDDFNAAIIGNIEVIRKHKSLQLFISFQ